MEKYGKSRVAVIIVLVVLLVILSVAGAFIFYLYNMATDRSEEYKLSTIASTDIYEPLVKSIILGEEQTITDDNINGIIRKIMDENPLTNIKSKDSVSIHGIAVYLQDNQTAEIYADISYKNIDMIFSAEAEITLDTTEKIIGIEVKNTRLGKLEIPEKYIMSLIEPSLEKLSKSIAVEETYITVPSEYKITFSKKEIELYIESFNISQGSATIQTNSAMNSIKQFIDEMISGWFA